MASPKTGRIIVCNNPGKFAIVYDKEETTGLLLSYIETSTLNML